MNPADVARDILSASDLGAWQYIKGLRASDARLLAEDYLRLRRRLEAIRDWQPSKGDTNPYQAIAAMARETARTALQGKEIPDAE